MEDWVKKLGWAGVIISAIINGFSRYLDFRDAQALGISADIWLSIGLGLFFIAIITLILWWQREMSNRAKETRKPTQQNNIEEVLGEGHELLLESISFSLSRFLNDQLSGLQALANSCRAEEDCRIPADIAFSLIMSATKNASFILSVDLELDSWSYILRQSDREMARSLFGAKSTITLDTDRSIHKRLDDFNNLFAAIEDRLDKEEPDFIWPARAVMRTFVLKDKSEFNWIRWAILNRLYELSCSHLNRDETPYMENRVLFLNEKPNTLLRDLELQNDIILFIDVNPMNLRFESHDPRNITLPGYKACGIRERLNIGGAGGHIESTVIGQPTRLEDAYRYGMKMWNIAEPFDPDVFAAYVQS